MTTTPWGGRVFYRETTTSTMDDAEAWQARGEPAGSVAWAGFQTAARPASWEKLVRRIGASLMLTAWWDPSQFRVPQFAPSLTVGLGVCLWLEELGLGSGFPIALKWPNDIYLEGRKLAGILVRQKLSSQGPQPIHAGIGINLAPVPPSERLRTPSASLADAGLNLSPADALEALLPALAAALDHPDPRSECERRLWRKDGPVELALPGQPQRSGVARGLDDLGRLLWEGPSGLETVSSGE